MITFRRLTHADVPMLSDWMARAHWRKWWGEPDEEVRYVVDMIEGRDTTLPYIFQVDGVDKGYIQVWFVKDQLGTEFAKDYPWLDLLPTDAVGVDLSIADQEDLSKGIGTRVLQMFVRKLRQEGHDRIIIDPDPVNTRAVRAYRNAGFREMPELVGKTDDSLLMEHMNTEGVS